VITRICHGQPGTIEGRDATGIAVSTAVRYDEAGRPLTIAEYVNGMTRDSYELFWDDEDRLIATNISFATGRYCGSKWIYSTCTGVRWHYHHLGRRLIAATREFVYTGWARGGH
jgi:hypothetical protein